MQGNQIKIRFIFPLLCLLCIIYGSLIPFHFRSVSFTEAVEKFQQIQYLSLGIVSRADWIANIILYLPLGFTTTAWTSKKNLSFKKSAVIIFSIFLFCISVALIMEFLQIFFSPRTVSLNDLLAESIGSLSGILLWLLIGDRVANVFSKNNEFSNSALSLNTAFFIYLLFLLCFTLFPFDFLISAQEIKWKYKTWKAQSIGSDFGSFRFLFKFIAEMALFLPIGLYAGLKYRKSNLLIKTILIFLFSICFALLLEILQFFVASGVSHFHSIFIRSIGACIGLFMAKKLFTIQLSNIKSYLIIVIIFGSPIYLLSALKLSGWSHHGWISLSEGLSKFDVHMLLPFYFHYFSTETRAVLSVVMNFSLYIPVGFSGYVFYCFKKTNKKLYTAISILISLLLSLLIESGKLFQKGLHPDYTNMIIAGSSVIIIFNLSEKIMNNFANFDSQ